MLYPKTRFAFPAFAFALALIPAPLAAQSRNAELTTPAIDQELFRPGEVTRVEREFGRWKIVCDEVRRLKQKFCSLRTLAIGPDDTPLASMVVSTGDNGRPAALLTLPFGITLGQKIIMSAQGIKGKVQPIKLDMTPALCTREGCQIIWGLSGSDINSLRNGVDFEVTFRAIAHAPGIDPYARQKLATNFTVRIYATGFNDALVDSTK